MTKYANATFVVFVLTKHSMQQNLIWGNARTPCVVQLIKISPFLCNCFFLGDIDADMCREEWNKLPQEEKDKYG